MVIIRQKTLHEEKKGKKRKRKGKGEEGGKSFSHMTVPLTNPTNKGKGINHPRLDSTTTKHIITSMLQPYNVMQIIYLYSQMFTTVKWVRLEV